MFGYTRLMVAAFGLGARLGGARPRDRRTRRKRIQAGGPLSREAGLHAQADRPARRARSRRPAPSIEETAERHRRRAKGALNTEGAIAKYLATEAGNAAADAAIQAHGGYGYTHDYMVEKIRRDVRITTIYEGTSEIMEMTIARDRWQQHLKTARRLLPRRRRASSKPCTPQHPDVGADVAALALPRAGRACSSAAASAGSPATSTSCSGSAS